MKLKEMFEQEMYVKEIATTLDDIIYSTSILRSNNTKLKYFFKLIAKGNMKDSTNDYDDAIMNTLLVVFNTFNELNSKYNLTEEEFVDLFLHCSNECITETDIESARLFKLIEKKCKQKLYKLNKVEEKKIHENLYGNSISVSNFSDFKAKNAKGKDRSLIDMLDAVSFDSNILFIDSKNKNKNILENWIEENKVILTNNERKYLDDPISIESSSSRSRYQKKIEDKLREKALEEFGIGDSKIIKLMIERDRINNILDSEDIKLSIAANLDYISELEGYYDISIDHRKEIIKVYSGNSYEVQNRTLIAFSSLLFKRLDKIEETLSKFKIDENKQEVVKKRAKFEMKNIPNINLDDNNEFPRSVKGSSPVNYQKFKKLHKTVFEEGLKLDGRFYNWLYFAQYERENSIDKKVRYYTYLHEDGMVYMIPEPLIKFISSDAKPTFLRCYQKYKGSVKWDGKAYSSSLTEDYDKAYDDLIKIKNDLLQNKILEEHKDLLSENTYDFLKNFRFKKK